MGDHDQSKGADHESQIDFPAEFQPGSVIHAAHGQLNQRTAGPETVGDAVPVLVGQHQHLLVDVQNVSQRLQDGHNDDCFSAAGHHQEIKERYKYKDNQQGQESALVFQKKGQAVDNGVHNAGLIQKNYHSLGHSHSEGGGEHPHCPLAEKLAGLAGTNAENQGQKDSHDDVDSRDLGEGPFQPDASVSLNDDDSQKDQQT